MALHKATLDQAVKVVETLKENHITAFHKQMYLYRLIEDIKFPHLKNSGFYNMPGSPRSRGGNAYVGSNNYDTIIKLLRTSKILTKTPVVKNGMHVLVKYSVNQQAVTEFLKVFGPKYKNY